MMEFSYHRPDDLPSALSLLRELGPQARPLAGGTDLLIELRKRSRRMADVQHVVDISRLEALRGITLDDDALHLGPLTTHAMLASSELVRQHAPLVAAGAASVGCQQTRNQGTLGGNVVNAAACADTVPGLVCYDARLVLRSSDGRREVAVSDFIRRPYDTLLEPNELLVGVIVPRQHFVAARWDFNKLGRRNAMAISRLTVAAVLDFDGGTVTEARVAAGSATPRPHRMASVEAMLVGKSLSDAVIDAAAQQMADDMVAEAGVRWSTKYKQPVLQNMTRRALARIAQAGVKA